MIGRRHLLAGLALLVVAASPRLARGMQSGVPVHGQLLSQQRGSVPGVTTYLVHPVLGRSLPSVTDAQGRFGWSAIPVRPEAYFLEMYWGTRLIYRSALPVRGPVQLQPITL
jgi:hypothetical protein